MRTPFLISIEAEDLPPVSPVELGRMLASGVLEDLAAAIIAAKQMDEGSPPAAVRAALDALVPRHKAAAAHLLPHLPIQIARMIEGQCLSNVGILVLRDERDIFACVLQGVHALIGSRDEIVRVLSFGLGRVHH
jgi:hypothetical protein